MGLGFDRLSMSSGFIPEVKAVLNHLRVGDCQELVAQTLEASTAEENEKLLEDYYQRQFSPELITPDLVILESDCGSKAEILQELAITFERAWPGGKPGSF